MRGGRTLVYPTVLHDNQPSITTTMPTTIVRRWHRRAQGSHLPNVTFGNGLGANCGEINCFFREPTMLAAKATWRHSLHSVCFRRPRRKHALGPSIFIVQIQSTNLSVARSTPHVPRSSKAALPSSVRLTLSRASQHGRKMELETRKV